jgi:hypothetical protein
LRVFTTETALGVSDRGTLRGITHFLPSPSSVRYNSLNPNVIGSALGRTPEVCDNLILTARNLLILQVRRDVRVVEGARLENDSGELHLATSKHFIAQSIQRLAAFKCTWM